MSLELLPTNDPSCLLFQGDSTPGWRVVPGPDGQERATPGLLIRQPHQTFFVEYGSLVPGVQVDDKQAREGTPACSEKSLFPEAASTLTSSSTTLPAATPSSPSEASTNPTKGASQLESSGSDVSKATASIEAEASDERPTSDPPTGTSPPGSVATPPLPPAPATVAAPYVAHAVQHACIPCMPQQALPVGMVPMFHQPQVLYQAPPMHAPPHMMVPMPPTQYMYPPHMHMVQQMPVPMHGAAFPPPIPPVYHRPLFTPRPPNHPPPPIRGGVRGAPARKPETTQNIPESPPRPCRMATTSSAFDGTPEDTPEDTPADTPTESPTARAPETLTVSTAARADKDDDEDEDESALSPIRAKYDALRVASSSTIASPTYALGAARSLTWGASRSLTGMLSMMSLGAVPEVSEEFEE